MSQGERGPPGQGGGEGLGAGVTSEGIDEQANEHGEHRHGDPVGEALVAHAAVDGHTCLVALQGKGARRWGPMQGQPPPPASSLPPVGALTCSAPFPGTCIVAHSHLW